MKPLLIFGVSGHARVVADIIELTGLYEIVGFVDKEPHPEPFLDYPVFAEGDSYAVSHAVIAVGDCRLRLRLAEKARRAGLELATAVHPAAVVARSALVGNGTVVAAGAVINPGTSVGENCIVNTLASVDHDCVVEDGAHVCPGVRLAGNVSVGRGAWVGIGSSVKQGIRIGEFAYIGAGSVVVRDVPPGALVYGNPARTGRTSR